MSTFDPNHYLLLAKELQGCDCADILFEAKQRSAISRAYYSAFVQARHKKAKPKDKHGVVWDIYQQSGDTKLVSIGQRLRSLYDLRCTADYEEVLKDPDWTAESAIDLAEDILSLLDNI